MTLHIYNPEHDIALAKNDIFFTPPKAAQTTRNAFCHLPALWAEEGDLVLVDDRDLALANAAKEDRKMARVQFVTMSELGKLKAEEMPEHIEPWGWDKYLVSRLLRCNRLFSSLVPNDSVLEDIRLFSSREFATVNLLPLLVATDNRLVGKAQAFRGNVSEILEYCRNNVAKDDAAAKKGFVLKSPWSCSGRGVRFISGDELSESLRGWVRRTLEEQGAMMIEPQYDKVLDFAMEFYANKQLGTRFAGLSLFTTNRGSYHQNIVETEENKRKALAQFVSLDIIDSVRDKIIELTSTFFRDKYSGPFGIDMMIVRNSASETKVHPCVEMNLRRTMGHAALLI